MRPLSLISLFDSNNIIQKETVPLKEVKVVNPPRNVYTVIQINPLTLEEQLIMYSGETEYIDINENKLNPKMTVIIDNE
jgi:hypothetical protein